MKSDPPRVRALRRQLTATFYRKNKATFFVTAGAMLLLGGALLAVAWILQQIIDIASGDSVAPLVRMCWLCLGVLVSVTTIYVVQCYTYPAFLRRAMKQYKEYAFTELTKKSISTFSDENTSRYISALTNDAVCIETNYLAKIFTLLTKSVSFVGGLVMMLLYSPLLTGFAPVAGMRDYWQTVTAYTRGCGRLSCALRGYEPCHNARQVIEAAAYDPEADLENTPDSVFCSHGAGHTVKWDRVKEFMHLESGLQEEKPQMRILPAIDDRELEQIMEREFGPIRRPVYGVSNRPAADDVAIRTPRQKYIIVDGYNVIFAWEDLAAQAKDDLDAARRQLCDRLSSYAGFTKCRLVVVFDGYKQKGNPGEKSQFHNIQVVYTKEGQTADAYIEALAHEIGRDYAVRVASSDGLVQLSSFGSGVLRMSARELHGEVEAARAEMRKHYRK